MDVFILFSQKEAFSLATVEAMATKVPVFVFSDSGGAAEVVRESGGGVIVKDEEEMIMKIAELLEDKERRKIIGKQGHTYVKEHWDIKKVVSQYKSLYKLVLEGK